MAIPRPRTGEKLPLVTVPTGTGPPRTSGPVAGGLAARRSRARAICRRGTVGARSTLEGGPGPGIALVPPHHPAQAGLEGVMPGPSSWPCRGNPASRRSVSRAPRPAGTTPASSTACQKLGRGVARGRHTRRRPRRCSRFPRPHSRRRATKSAPRAKRGTAAASGATDDSRRRACGSLHGDHGSGGGGVVTADGIADPRRCSTRWA